MSLCFKMDKSDQILAQSENNEMIIDEDCEVTVIEEATTTDGVVNKSCRSAVWWYFLISYQGKKGRGVNCACMY